MFLLHVAGLLMAAGVAPQTAPDPAAIVAQTLGSGFVVDTRVATPLTAADLDGDGVPDTIVAVRRAPSKDAHRTQTISEQSATTAELLHTAAAHAVAVADPYDGYWGWGNPKVTARFMGDEPSSRMVLVLLSSAQAEDAVAAKNGKDKHPIPHAFLLLNLPFDELAATTIDVRKRSVGALRLTETRVMSSLLYWDGKRWRWKPGDVFTE